VVNLVYDYRGHISLASAARLQAGAAAAVSQAASSDDGPRC
jgi:hypothetical protein